MPFSKLAASVRAQPLRSFLVFLGAHFLSLAVCMIYPIALMLSEYSDERLMKHEISDFQNFIHNAADVFVMFMIYTLPAFILAAMLFMTAFFQDHRRFRHLCYVLTGVALFATIYIDTMLGIKDHLMIYGTAALYVVALYVGEYYLSRRMSAKK